MTDLLLDTHIFIWMLTEESRLTKSNREIIENCWRSGHQTCLSAISIWEIAMLERKNRLSFSMPISKWIGEAIRQSATRIMELSPEIMIDSCNLPGEFHPDPVDRMIVSTARISNIPLVTQDSRILEYISRGLVPM